VPNYPGQGASDVRLAPWRSSENPRVRQQWRHTVPVDAPTGVQGRLLVVHPRPCNSGAVLQGSRAHRPVLAVQYLFARHQRRLGRGRAQRRLSQANSGAGQDGALQIQRRQDDLPCHVALVWLRRRGWKRCSGPKHDNVQERLAWLARTRRGRQAELYLLGRTTHAHRRRCASQYRFRALWCQRKSRTILRTRRSSI
ncbi:hypothetical protein IWW47_005440, partial [Coemansia sp. RSA 2052]